MKKLIQDYLSEVKQVADEINIKDIAKVIVVLYDAWVQGKNVFICGNGGSASTASHFTSDLSKLGLRTFCLNDNSARMTAITNDSGFSALFTEQLYNLLNKDDVLVCISVHGGIEKDKDIWSQNIVLAVDYAKQVGAKTIGLVGFEGGILRRTTDASIKINSYSTPQVESWHCHICHLLPLILSEFQPVKVCKSCSLIRKIDKGICDCGGVDYELAIGVIGNIEEIKKLI